MREFLSCIACGNSLPNLARDSGSQPGGGLEFTSPGHYSSQAFNPMDGTRLSIYVCDSCLVIGARLGRVDIETQPEHPGVASVVEPWQPPMATSIDVV